MAKQAVATRATDLEPIDRLEEKVKRLVEVITQLRSEQAKSAEVITQLRAEQTKGTEDHERLTQELAALRSRLAEAEQVNGEVAALRDERDVIRTRVTEMLQQLESI